MKIALLMKALSPITHGAETAGNEQLIAMLPVSTSFGVKHVPIISGNSMRHRMLREPHADEILRDELVSKEQLRWLFNGGELAGKCPNIDTKRIAFVQSLMPHVDLLGCSLPDTIVSGRLNVGIAWLACMETQQAIRSELEGLFDPAVVLPPAHEFIRGYQYFRHDASKNRETADDSDTAYKGMPHGGEHVIAGATFVCVMHAAGLSELAKSALVWGLEKWAERGATLGGQSSRGHGRMQPYLWADEEVSSNMYAKHLEEKRKEMLEFVRTLYRKAV